ADQLGRGRSVHREELRLYHEWHLQVLAPTLELRQPVGLALRRALGERQPARLRKDDAEVDRFHVYLGSRLLRNSLEARVAKVGPRRTWGHVVVNRLAHEILQK